MRRSPRNLRIACDHRGLTHFGGIYFFHEFLQLLQLRDFLARHLSYPRRNHRYRLSQMILALVYPLVLGLDRLETTSFLRSNGTFQYLTGLPGLRYQAVNRDWEMADFEHRPHGWPQARRLVVARRFIPEEEAQTTLFTLGRYVYRAWVTNRSLTPAGVWHFYDGRAGMEPRTGELREYFALRKIPTASFAANALYLEIIRLAYNLVTAFQRNCLQESWQNLTLAKLRHKLFWLPGELTRPQNRPVLRLRESPMLRDLTNDGMAKTRKLKPLQL